MAKLINPGGRGLFCSKCSNPIPERRGILPGHWEGDLHIGLERSAIGTLVDRTSRFTMLIHLPREEGYRHKAHTQERAIAGRLWSNNDQGRSRVNDHHASRTTAPILDMGPRQGDVGTRPIHNRVRSPCLLRRPAQSVAARDEREHQWPASSVLPEGHRPISMERRRDRSRRSRSQQAAQDARMEDASRDT